MISIDINSIVILNISDIDYRCISPKLAKVKPSIITNKKTEMFEFSNFTVTKSKVLRECCYEGFFRRVVTKSLLVTWAIIIK